MKFVWIKTSLLFLIFVCLASSAFSKTGAFKLGGKTPILESSALFLDNKPTGSIKLEVSEKISKSSDHTYGNALEMERRDTLTRQKIYLEIKLTNLLPKRTSSLTIKYEIFGIEREKEFLRGAKLGKVLLATSGNLFFNESLKFGESRILKTDTSTFEVQKTSKTVEVMHRGAVTEQTMSGLRYSGYHVSVFDDKNILVAELKK